MQKATKQTRPSNLYFDTESFIEKLLKEMKMDQSPEHIKRELSEEIAKTLSERVTATVVASLGEKEIFMLEKLMEDHPELDEIDGLSIITSYIPDLDQLILKAVSDLYDELVENARMIDSQLNK